MDNPLISIVICCYNRAHLLPQTMASVFNQSYRPVEIVVVDDGSTDETPELMAGYGDGVRYYWQKNQGIATARTTGGRLAKGEFIAYQDDDDLMPSDRLEKLYEAFCRYPGAVLSVGDREVIDAEGNPTGERVQSKLNVDKQNYLILKEGYKAVLRTDVDPVPHTTIFRRSDGERIGWFDNRFFYGCEDTDFFARLGQLGAIVYIPKVVSYYRKGHDSLAKSRILMDYSRFLFFEKHLKSRSLDDEDVRKLLRFRLRNVMENISYYYYNSSGILPNQVPDNYLDRGLALIGSMDRALYMWATLIKFPIQKFIYGLSKKKED